MILIILNVALAGFTGLLAWFLKELWGLWRESEKHRDKMQEHMHAIELRLAMNYVPLHEFKEHRDGYVRPSIHDLKERVGTIEHKALYGDKKE